MFLSEKELSARIKQELAKNPAILFRNKLHLETFIAEEINLGYGIADLVVSFCKKIEERRQSLNIIELSLLRIIQKNKGTSVAKLSNLTKNPLKKVNKAILKLEQEGFVCLSNEQIYSLTKYRSFQTETIAIEVKLKNWKRALKQAYRYRNFAFNSYVFMDAKHISPAIKNKELFLQYNVGLASVSITGEISIIYKPKRGNPFDEKMNMLLNETIVNHYLSCKKVSQVSR